MKDLRKILGDMPKEERRWLLGNEGKSGIHSFDGKRVVHAGLSGKPIMDPEEQQRVWKEEMNKEASEGTRSIYIHIPFCEKKCSYCGFFQNASKDEVLERYTDLVIEEIKMAAKYKRAQSGTFNAVYFGGGTPSTLAAKDIERLVRTVYEELPLARDCEVTLESRVHDMTDEKIEAALRGGINRFSLGVQSFDTKIRQAVGRIDPEEVVIERLKRLISYDSAAVTIDLMFGLPYQTMETWLRDIEIQFEIGLHGGDMYQLNVFPHSDLAKHIEKGKVPACMPTEEQAKLYVKTLEYIRELHPRIDVFDPSHWAASRRERNVYNHAAKTRGDMLCFGSCAGGRLGNISMMQHRDLKAYIAAMEAGVKPVAMMIDDGGIGKLAGEIKSQLENMYLDGNHFKRHWGLDLMNYLAPIIESWVAKGLITFNGDNFRFTDIGMFWHDNLIQAVLEAVRLGKEEGYVHLRKEDVAHQDKHITKFLEKEKEGAVIFNRDFLDKKKSEAKAKTQDKAEELKDKAEEIKERAEERAEEAKKNIEETVEKVQDITKEKVSEATAKMHEVMKNIKSEDAMAKMQEAMKNIKSEEAVSKMAEMMKKMANPTAKEEEISSCAPTDCATSACASSCPSAAKAVSASEELASKVASEVEAKKAICPSKGACPSSKVEEGDVKVEEVKSETQSVATAMAQVEKVEENNEVNGEEQVEAPKKKRRITCPHTGFSMEVDADSTESVHELKNKFQNMMKFNVFGKKDKKENEEK